MLEKRSARQLIEESIVDLTAQVPIERISVRRIVENCGVSRQTFYNCFEDKYALVDAIYRKQVTRIIHEHDAGEPLGAVLLDVLNGIHDNGEFYRNWYCRRDDITGFVQINRQFFRQMVEDRMEAPLEGDNLFMADFLADAFVQCMSRWVTDGMVETPEQMRDLIVRCVPNGLTGIMRLG